ncbi:MAG: diacylglycerol kinase, partial [Thermodesulfobacteriota bacterium]
MKNNIIKPKNWLESLNCATEGIIYAAKTQRHMRYHFVIATIVLLLSLFLNLPTIEFVLLAISVIILLFAEMMNTAIEETVNLIEQKYNIIAKNTKDISAGAVLIASMCVAIMGYVILSKHLFAPFSLALETAKTYTGHLAVVSFFLVIIGVVITKAYLGKGKPLYGGLPSGHSAVAFSLWTSISLLTMDPMVAILSFIMATMVSHSRLLTGIHTKTEVTLGAILGVGITSLIFY